MPTSTQVYSDDKVTVTAKGVVNYANVHASSHSQYVMRVRGKNYEHVRGWIPFYVDIPKKKSILFVTESLTNGIKSATVHIVNLKSGEEIAINASASEIGSNPLDRHYEKEVVWEGDSLILEVRLFRQRMRYYFDLRSKSMNQEEIWTIDRDGGYVSGETNRYSIARK